MRRIERATGVRRETASGYLKAAGVVVRGRGRPPTAAAKPAISPEVSTDSSAAPSPGAGTDPAPATSGGHPSPSPRASACEPYRQLIVEAVDRGRNAMAIWQQLVDAHGFAAGYASVRRFVAKLRQRPAAEARVVITTAPGEEAQVDYGSGPMVRDPVSGKYRRTRLFVLTLGYSRKSVRLLTREGRVCSGQRRALARAEPPFEVIQRVLLLSGSSEGMPMPKRTAIGTTSDGDPRIIRPESGPSPTGIGRQASAPPPPPPRPRPPPPPPPDSRTVRGSRSGPLSYGTSTTPPLSRCLSHEFGALRSPTPVGAAAFRSPGSRTIDPSFGWGVELGPTPALRTEKRHEMGLHMLRCVPPPSRVRVAPDAASRRPVIPADCFSRVQ